MIIAATARGEGDDKRTAVVTQLITQKSVTSKDSNRLRELERKVTTSDELLQKLLRDLKTLNINEIRE